MRRWSYLSVKATTGTGMENAESTINFEKSLKELEQIVRELESGDVNLDQSLKKFEQGIELYKMCRSTLENAEKKIKILSDSLKELDYKE
jgi:exodeoxyribonuclease VII small subunit